MKDSQLIHESHINQDKKRRYNKDKDSNEYGRISN